MDAETERFWTALRDERQLLLRRCRTCGCHLDYPRVVCTSCYGGDLEWVRSLGTGTIHSFTVSHRQVGGFDLEAPYVVALIDLDEGARLLSNVVGSEPGAVRIGDRVALVIEDLSDDRSVPRFSRITG